MVQFGGGFPAEWGNPDVFIALFFKSYREKVQHYAEEEKRLWEDYRHGMIIGTKGFVDRIRSKYIPDNFHKEIPQYRALGKSVDPEKVLGKAAGILNCVVILIISGILEEYQAH